MAVLMLALAASALCVGPHRTLPRASPVLRRAAGPLTGCAAASADWPAQVTLTPEQVGILLQRIYSLEARVEQLETRPNALAAAGRLRLGSRVASHFSATAARLSGSAPLPGLRARLVLGAAVGPANVSGTLVPAAELRTPITFRSEFLRLLSSFGRDAPAADAVARAASAADPATLVPDSDALFFSQLSATTAAAIDSAAQSAKASVDFALDKAVSDVDKVLNDASRLASSVIAPPRLPAGPPPTGRVTRARLDSILQKRDALLRRRERLLQQPREVVARTLGAVNATLGALNSTLALAEKQLASRRLLGASFALGTGGGLVLHFAVSGFGGGLTAAPLAALRALVGGCVAAYSSTLANRLGALARLMAAIALTLWDQLLEKRRQAEFVYHTGRLFERMDTQMQAWQLEKWAGAPNSALEGASGFVNEWYANTSASLGAAMSGGWNSTVSTAASTAGVFAPVSASVAFTLAKLDNATRMSQGVAFAAQGFDSIGKGVAGAGEAAAQMQREWFASSGKGKEGEPTGGATGQQQGSTPQDGEARGGQGGAAEQGQGPPGSQITPVEGQEQPAPQWQEAQRAPDGIASAFAYARLPLESLLFFRPSGFGNTPRW